MDLTTPPDEFAAYCDRLRGLVDDLWYPSETDAPVTVVVWAVEHLDPSTVAAQAGCGVDEVIVRSPEDWFNPILTNHFWRSAQGEHLAQRYEALHDLLWSTLSDLHSYQVGDVEQHIYVVGRHPAGGYVGVQTMMVVT